MLAGKAGVRQLFGCRRTAHGDCGTLAALLLERAIGTDDLLVQGGIAGRFIDDPACGGGAPGEERDLADIEIHQAAQFLAGAGGVQRVAIG